MAYRPTSRIWAPSALTVSAVTTADLKDHLRVTHSLEDALIGAYGLAATGAIEKASQRLLQVRAATLRLTDLPSGQEPIELPGGAVASITSVTADGAAITGCTVLGDSPAILLPASDWPIVTGQGYPVTITYQAGHATVPQALVQAVKLMVGHLYANRSAVGESSMAELPLAVGYLIGQYRILPA
jgi:uncharacterized phiE125 gp8 family phage protein